MAMSVAVVQDEAVALLNEMGIPCKPKGNNLYAVDAIELAAGLCYNALQAGATILNLMTAEDLCLHHGRVTGVVVNRTTISGALPVDPITFSSRAALDATATKPSSWNAFGVAAFCRLKPRNSAKDRWTPPPESNSSWITQARSFPACGFPG